MFRHPSRRLTAVLQAIGAPERLSPTFIAHVSEILAATGGGLSGSDIAKLMRGYAIEYSVEIPHGIAPLQAPNKRTALYENLQIFTAPQQHRIIRELCAHVTGFRPESSEIKKIRILLATQYKKYNTDTGTATINETLIEETRHWLDACPDVLTLYNGAIEKFRAGVFERNVLDDLRLSLELLLKATFKNNQSFENQISSLGQFIKSRGGSSQFTNMFVKLVEYYGHYQNTYVKHADNVIEQEIEFVIEITSAFMKHVVRMDAT